MKNVLFVDIKTEEVKLKIEEIRTCVSSQFLS